MGRLEIGKYVDSHHLPLIVTEDMVRRDEQIINRENKKEKIAGKGN